MTLWRQEAAPATQGHPRIRILTRSTRVVCDGRLGGRRYSYTYAWLLYMQLDGGGERSQRCLFDTTINPP